MIHIFIVYSYLQASLVSRNPSEIIQIFWFGAQTTVIINQWWKQYFLYFKYLKVTVYCEIFQGSSMKI